jgi:hypothetical protein
MNEFEYINHKTSDLFHQHLDSRINFQLQLFHNNYRYDPALDVVEPHFRVKDRIKIKMILLDRFNTCRTCGGILANTTC